MNITSFIKFKICCLIFRDPINDFLVDVNKDLCRGIIPELFWIKTIPHRLAIILNFSMINI
jgi:hypothetical protein